MIIECPACTTRYDIKAMLPPEGRTVRCAKCGTVWRAKPAAEEEFQAVIPEPETTAIANHADASAGGQDRTDETFQHRTAPSQDREESWLQNNASKTEHADAVAEVSEAVFSTEFRESAVPAQHEAFPFEMVQDAVIWPGRDRKETVAEPGREKDESGKVRWFGSFRRKNQARTGASAGSSAEPGLSGNGSAEAIPFPRLGPAAEGPAAADETAFSSLEEAREAVRGVFSSRGEVSAAARNAQAALITQALERDRAGDAESLSAEKSWHYSSPQREMIEDTDESEVQQELAAGPGLMQEEGGTDRLNAAQTESWSSAGETQGEGAGTANWLKGWREQTQPEADDPDASLRSAFHAHFATASGNENLSEQLEAHLRPSTVDEEVPEEFSPGQAAPIWRMPGMQSQPRFNESATDDGLEETREDDPSFDRRLYREIEETQGHAVQGRPARRGGLALAAAWGLFLCIAAGLAVGFVAFRDEVADAIPGLSPVYGALGMPVTAQPLVFENVQYEWQLKDNKPTLLITGSVRNHARRKVKVPPFFVTIKDDDPALDREYSVNLQVTGDRIRPRRSADFEIELLAPNPAISSVELELRNVR